MPTAIAHSLAQSLCPLMLAEDAEPVIVEGEFDHIANDVALLVSMARRIPAAWDAWRQRERADTLAGTLADTPFIFPQEDTHSRPLRTVICTTRDDLSPRRAQTAGLALDADQRTQHPFARALPFVGFVSQARFDLPQELLEAIAQADRQLVAQLTKRSHVLAYSSLDLGEGAWCNLVLFRDAHGKEAVTSLPGHREAAYELAPRYYRWIRLHHGTLAIGREHPRLWLERTKFYTFQPFQDRGLPPELRTETYTEAAAARAALRAAQHSAPQLSSGAGAFEGAGR